MIYKTKDGNIVESIEINVYSTNGKCLFSDILSPEITEKILSGAWEIILEKEFIKSSR